MLRLYVQFNLYNISVLLIWKDSNIRDINLKNIKFKNNKVHEIFKVSIL